MPQSMDAALEHAAPPKRPWVGLTDDEIKAAWLQSWHKFQHASPVALDDLMENATINICRAVEQALKEKNT